MRIDTLKKSGFLPEKWGDSVIYWHPVRNIRYEHWPGKYCQKLPLFQEDDIFSDSEIQNMSLESEEFQSKPIIVEIFEGRTKASLIYNNYQDFKDGKIGKKIIK